MKMTTGSPGGKISRACFQDKKIRQMPEKRGSRRKAPQYLIGVYLTTIASLILCDLLLFPCLCYVFAHVTDCCFWTTLNRHLRLSHGRGAGWSLRVVEVVEAHRRGSLARN